MHINGKEIKNILNGQEAREMLLAGVTLVAEVVGSTLGPKGRNVTNRKLDGQLQTTKDGVTVAEWIKTNDPFLAVGADMIKSASKSALRNAGDGTTTATVLTKKLVSNLIDLNDILSPVVINNDLDKLLKYFVDTIEAISTPIDSDLSKLEQVATISANNNAELGKMVAKAVYDSGTHGKVRIVKTGSQETTVKVTTGHSWDSGYIINTCVTDSEKQVFNVDDCKVIFLSGTIADVDSNMLKSLYSLVMNNSKSLLLVTQDPSDQVIQAVANLNYELNRSGRSQRIALVRAAGHGNLRYSYMGDMARVMAVPVLNNDSASWDAPDLAWLNEYIAEATSVVVDAHQTSIQPKDAEVAESLALRIIGDLQNSMNSATDEFDKRTAEKRIAIMSGRMVTIYVGGISEEDTGDRNDLIDDAVRACQCANQKGILPGGGNVYRYLSHECLSGDKLLPLEVDDLVLKAVCDALLEPFRLILTNAGIPADVELTPMVDVSFYNQGIDVYTGKEIAGLLSRGIVDPTIVSISSLQSAFAVTKNILMTNTIIVPTASL